jgi:putative hydrolase of the HAD superfamily
VGGARYDAVLLDAYGTLVELDDPFERLRESVRRHIGADVELEDAERAFRAEMAHYAGNCQTGADAESLAALRADCSILAELGLEAEPPAAERMLTDAVVFRLLPDVEPLLAGLAQAEVPAAVVSNWDCTLRRTLTGLGLELDAIVTCGETGVRKPDPRVFLEALGRLGVAPARALHVGDSRDTDAAGAEAAGIDVRIVDRTGGSGGPDTIASLTEVLELL